jgi:hypothetical protein
MGRTPIFVSGEVDGSIVCIGIFSIRPLFWGGRFSLEAYCLRGPVFDNVELFKEFIQCVIARFKKLGIGSVRISPYWQFPEAEEVESVLAELGFLPYNRREGTRSSTGYVDLTRSEDEILAAFSKQSRYHIRKAEKSALEIRPVTDMDEAILTFRCLSNMRTIRGLTPMSLSEFRALFQYVLRHKEQGVLLGAFWETEFLGGLWIIRDPCTTHIPCYAIEADTCKRLTGTLTIGYPLWWQAMKLAKEKRCHWFDVEGYSEAAEESSRVYQIYKFKGNFHPKPVKIISEHICVCNTVTYSIYEGHRFFLRGCRFLRSLPYRIDKQFRSNKAEK